MKFNIKKTLLLKPLQKLNNIITINHESPITNNIVLKLKKNSILLTSTNLEMELTTQIQLLGYDYDSEINIPGKKLLNIIRSFPDNININFTIKKNIIKITYENIYFELKISNNHHFPKFIQDQNSNHITLQQIKLKNIFYNTAFSMAKQDIRHYLNGIHLEISKNKICSVSTDGYRMSICYTKINYENKSSSIIIPRKTVIEVMKILENNEKNCIIYIGSKMVQFRINEYIISSKLIDNEFPNYKNFFIQDFHQQIKINKILLKTALTRASILTNQKFPGVKLSIKDKICIISSKNENNEIVREILTIDNINTTIELTMNINYFIDVINVIDDEFITIFLNKNISSIYIQHIRQYHSFYIIMPLII